MVGSYVALSKPLVAALPVFLLAWLRFGIGGAAMLHWLKKPAFEAPMSSQTKRLLFLESFLGNFLFSICMLFGVSLTSAVAAGVIMASIPAAVAVMSWLFLRERISLRVWLAVACAVLGVALVSLSKQELVAPIISGPGADLASKNAWLGNLLLVGAVLCEAAYAVIGKKTHGRPEPPSVSPRSSTCGVLRWSHRSVCGWPGALTSGRLQAQAGCCCCFTRSRPACGTVWLWMTGLKTVPANRAGVFTVLLPVSAAATGVIVLGEKLNSTQIGAFAIALIGVVLATLPQRGQPGTGQSVLPH